MMSNDGVWLPMMINNDLSWLITCRLRCLYFCLTNCEWWWPTATQLLQFMSDDEWCFKQWSSSSISGVYWLMAGMARVFTIIGHYWLYIARNDVTSAFSIPSLQPDRCSCLRRRNWERGAAGCFVGPFGAANRISRPWQISETHWSQQQRRTKVALKMVSLNSSPIRWSFRWNDWWPIVNGSSLKLRLHNYPPAISVHLKYTCQKVSNHQWTTSSSPVIYWTKSNINRLGHHYSSEVNGGRTIPFITAKKISTVLVAMHFQNDVFYILQSKYTTSWTTIRHQWPPAILHGSLGLGSTAPRTVAARQDVLGGSMSRCHAALVGWLR